MFNASLDTTSKLVTALVSIGLLLPSIIIPFFIPEGHTLAMLPAFIIALPLLIITYVYSPTGYAVDTDNIIVQRKANNFFIPREGIDDVKAIDRKELGFAWRTFGNGGMFGYTGYFSSRNIGSMRWFVSQRKNYVLITMKNGKKYLLSPDDQNGFLAALA